MKHKGVKIFLVAGLLLVVLFVYGLNSRTVLEWSLAKLSADLPGSLQIERIDGSLLGPIELAGLKYEADKVTLGIEKLHLDWQPDRLLLGHIHLNELDVNQVQVTVHAADEQMQTELVLPDIIIPFPVAIENGLIREFTLLQLDQTSPLYLDEVMFGIEASTSSLTIEKLVVKAPIFSLSVQGEIEPSGSYPVDVDVTWAVRVPEFKPFSGNANLSGNLSDVQVVAQIEQPSGVQLNGQLVDILTDVHWQATLGLDEFDLAQIRADLPPIRINGTGTASGSLSTYGLIGQFNTKVPQAGAITAELDVNMQASTLDVRHLQVAQADSSMRVKVNGTMDLGKPEPHFDGRADWQDFQWPLTGPALVKSPAGKLQVAGTVDHYELFLYDTDVQYQRLLASKVSTRGSGSTRQIMLRELKAQVLDGGVEGQGTITWLPEFQWRAEIQASGLNPAEFQADWPGRLALDLKANGVGAGKDFSVAAHMTNLHGTLREQAVQGRGSLKKKQQRFEFSDVDLKMGTASLAASGSLDKEVDVTWKLSAPDISVFEPSMRGAVESAGRVYGPQLRPQIVAELSAEKLISERHLIALEKLNANINLDLRGKQRSQIQITANELSYQDFDVHTLQLGGDGVAEQHTVELLLAQDSESLNLRAQGELTQQHWQGQLQTIDIRSTSGGNWSLEEPGRLLYANGEVTLHPVCLQNKAAKLCSEIQWQTQKGWRTAFRVVDFPLSLLQPLLRPDIRLIGNVVGRGQLAASNSKLTKAELALKLDTGSVNVVGDEDELPVFVFDSGKIQLAQQGKGVHASANINSGDKGKFSFELTLPAIDLLDSTFDEEAVDGKIKLNTTQLESARLFYPELGVLSGEIRADIAIDGVLAHPRFVGGAVVDQVAVEVPQLGLNLHDINFRAEGTPQGTLKYSGSLQSGEGQLKLSGETKLEPRSGWPGHLNISGTEFEVVGLENAKVRVSPDLNVRRTGRRIDVNGEVIIPNAKIEAVSVPASAAISRDVVFVDEMVTEEERKQRETLWQIYSKVKIVVGDDVNFNGYGLKGKLAGNIEVSDEPGRATTGQGSLHVTQGKFSAFGVALNIDIGRVIFAGGPVADPGINARASRKYGDVIAGMRVQGRLRTPEISVFSTPSMPENEVMSYLLFGRVIRDTSFGLNEFTQPGSGDSGSLSYGSYLSPKLYVNYVTGLLTPTSVVRVRFQVADHWELHTESSSTHRAADAVFTFER